MRQHSHTDCSLARMKNILCLMALVFCGEMIHAQQKNKLPGISVTAKAQVVNMLYDRTRQQNGTGFGGSVQIAVPINQKIKAFMEGTAFALGGTKDILIINGEPLIPKDAINSIHAGITYRIANTCWINTSAGPSFFLNETKLGFRQAIQIFTSKKEKLGFYCSFDHVLRENSLYSSNFGYLSFGLMVRLF